MQAFERKALEIQNGGIEFCESRQWLNLTWFPDELALIELSTGGKLQDFFAEAQGRLLECAEKCNQIAPDVISQAMNLNRHVIEQRPFIRRGQGYQYDYNILEVYQAALNGHSTAIEKGAIRVPLTGLSAVGQLAGKTGAARSSGMGIKGAIMFIP